MPYYLVKWTGWLESDNSWIRELNFIEGAKELIEDYKDTLTPTAPSAPPLAPSPAPPKPLKPLKLPHPQVENLRRSSWTPVKRVRFAWNMHSHLHFFLISFFSSGLFLLRRQCKSSKPCTPCSHAPKPCFSLSHLSCLSLCLSLCVCHSLQHASFIALLYVDHTSSPSYMITL